MNNDDQQQPMNGDDDLAKALDGGLQFEETPVDGQHQNDNTGGDDMHAPTVSPMDTPSDSHSGDDTAQEPQDTTQDNAQDKAQPKSDAGNSDLDKLKAAALDDLRPLVGKLDLDPKDKFDTLLLIIRSTDDQSLLGQAHQAAKEITDDTERAQALLEVIKEADYFNSK